MKFKIKAKIEMKDDDDLETLFTAISPENITFPENDGEVESIIKNNILITKIDGMMGIARLVNTIDDILKTAILAKQIINDNSLD